MNKVFVLLITGLFVIACYSCNQNKTLFESLPSEKTGIDFQNTILENDSVNILDFENVYNGGGVGVGDFNNDGLQDLYFTGNLVSNKLYLNKGNFKFQDITKAASVEGEGKWNRGVAVVDINNDGWLDMYVCATLKKDPIQRKHLLYVNQGPDKEGIPHFKNIAKEYGLADTSQGTQAAFFDYDNDGDLDVYIVNNEIIKFDFPNRFRPAMKDGSHPNTDKLFRNDWNDSLKHPVFTNVSQQAGITIDGYGHAVAITDINRDGWKDIYVTNDYLSNDLLWINNKNGTFSEQLNTYFKHTSANAMGNEVTDINNDGLVDVVVLDMNPEDNYRKKMMLNPNSYQTYQNSDYYGYGYQYVRNTLQLNQGPRILQNDSIGAPIFSDISFYAGIAETDWSWAPVVADFDNDSYRDIIITNGFPKDVTDHDFVAFRNESFSVASKKQLLEQIPEVKIHNYAFRNSGKLQFENVSAAWGFTTPSFSNGGAYVDLDNDGDLDMVVNNINDKAGVYKNQLLEKKTDSANYLNIQFKGDRLNIHGIGAITEIYYDNGKHQLWENSPYRGYLSSIQNIAHFGLGKTTQVDSVIIYWPNGMISRNKNVPANQTLSTSIVNASPNSIKTSGVLATQTLFKEITKAVGINYVQEERDFIDFNIQKLLPHKLSEYGPGVAVGDLDGNGLDDLVISGSFSYSGQLFLQMPNGGFIQKKLLAADGNTNKRWEELGLLLIDLDKDGDLDIYATSGGYESQNNTSAYQDRIYINNGAAEFSLDTLSLPRNFTSKSCARAFDFDRDGDLDIFVAGRVDPWNYPKPVSGFIYRNDSKNGKIILTDVSATVSKDLNSIGMTCDAVCTDFDNDGWIDLVLAGEWMPVTFLKNDKGIFKNITSETGISNLKGWWNTLAPGDFDNDGDIDYIAGNMGQNSFYRASAKFPAYITAKDFDNNGSFDAFPSLYLPDQKGIKREYPAQTRDDIVKQMISMRTTFQNYKTYANATMDEVLTAEQRKGAIRLEGNTTQSIYLRNDGHGKFSSIPLPAEAQFSTLNGIVVDDFNGDGNLDAIINGNDYGTEVSVGRYDALNGLLITGDGKGNFTPYSILQSGIFIPGNGKGLVTLMGNQGKYWVAAGQNRGPLKVYELKKERKNVKINPDDMFAILTFKDGRKQKREFYFGSSFLSQSGRTLFFDNNITAIEIINSKSEKRNIPLL